MIGIDCDVHGFILLTKRQFENQKHQEGHWKCPKCRRQSKGVEISSVLIKRGCRQCQKQLTEQIVYNEYHVALFCDKFCEATYLVRFKEELKNINPRGS